MSGLIDRIAKTIPSLLGKSREIPTLEGEQMDAPENKLLSSKWAPSRDIDFYRMLLVGLSVDCPLDKSPDNCFLKNERLLSFEDKMDWAQSLSDHKIMELYMLHHKCLHAIKGVRAN